MVPKQSLLTALLCLLLALTAQARKVRVEADIFWNDGTHEVVDIYLPLKKGGIDKLKVQSWGFKAAREGEKFKVIPEEVRKVEFEFNDRAYTYRSMTTSDGSDQRYFLAVLISGEANIAYKYAPRKYPIPFFYVFFKEEDDPKGITPYGPQAAQIVKASLPACDALDEALESGAFQFETLPAMARFYNEHCVTD